MKAKDIHLDEDENIAGVMTVEQFNDLQYRAKAGGILQGIKASLLIFADLFYGRDVVSEDQLDVWAGEVLAPNEGGKNVINVETTTIELFKKIVAEFGQPQPLHEEHTPYRKDQRDAELKRQGN